MLKGYNLVGQTESKEGDQLLQEFSTVSHDVLPENFSIATTHEIDNAVAKAVAAFDVYKNITGENKAIFLGTIAEEVIAHQLVRRPLSVLCGHCVCRIVVPGFYLKY